MCAGKQSSRPNGSHHVKAHLNMISIFLPAGNLAPNEGPGFIYVHLIALVQQFYSC